MYLDCSINYLIANLIHILWRFIVMYCYYHLIAIYYYAIYM